MSNNRDYWRKRAELLEEALNNKGMEYLESLEREYKRAAASIEKDVSVWYQRFAENNQISLADANKYLTNKELKELRWTLEEYIKYGKENAINQEWIKELENASAKYHISRLDSLKLQLQQQVEVLFGNQVDDVDKLLRDIYTEGYYHTAFEIQKGINLGWKLEGISSKQLDQVLSKPWSTDASTFSDNIWRKKEDMVRTVQSELGKTIARGDAPDKAIKTIASKLQYYPEKETLRKRMFNAGRVAMTELSHLQAVSQRQCYKDLDVDKFEVVGTLDGITCDTCGAMDGKVFKMSDYESGVTANPFHCWCRCCTAPYFDDMYAERIARDPKTGETYTVPGDMTYEEWYKKYVDEPKEKEYNNTKEQIRESIKSDETNKKLNVGNQNKHIRDSKGYIDGRSYIYGDLETAQRFVDKYSGTGEIKLDRKGKWTNKEFITVQEDVGVLINQDTKAETPTNRFSIHYGKRGTHIVPAKRR